MKIAVLGGGNIGRTLAQKWVQAGHEIVLGLREPAGAKAQALLEAVSGNVSAGNPAEAITFGEVVLFAIPWAAVDQVTKTYGSALAGKIVIDATNNFGGPVVNNLAAFRAGAPKARVYRAFNSLGWENFAEPTIGGVQIDHFYCGADDEGRVVVEGLIADVGLRPVYVGGLELIHVVDAVGSLWINLAIRQNLGRHLAFKLLTDPAG